MMTNKLSGNLPFYVLAIRANKLGQLQIAVPLLYQSCPSLGFCSDVAHLRLGYITTAYKVMANLGG